MINRIAVLLSICFATSLLVSCGVVSNPFAASTGTRTNACAVDLSLPVELERARFTPPEIWSRIKPCEMVFVSQLYERDTWGISARLHYTYADVLVYDTAMGFGVEGNINLIGSAPPTIEGWNQREEKKWKQHIRNRGISGKRTIIYESRNGLDCWRTEKVSFDRDKKKDGFSVGYDCWEPGKAHYPPLGIGGWVGYRDGKPIYDLDIDKDLIDPVFATLEVKEIKPEVYAERMAIHEKKMVEDCKWRKKDLRKYPNQTHNAYSIERLEACGFNTSKLKRKEE